MITANRGEISEESWMFAAALYELASMGFLLPGRALAEALSSGEYADACSEAFEGLDFSKPVSLEALAAYEGADVEALFHDLRREYTRLFSKAPEPLITPYIGVWDERKRGGSGLLFVSEESMAIERFMRRCGVAKDISAGQSNDPVDHIGTVCEFLEYLCLVNARAVEPAAGAEVREDDFDEFFEKHFCDYALWCAAEIRKNDSSAFYAFAADMLEQVALRF